MEDISILGVINFLLRRARLVFGVPIAVAIAAVVLALLAPGQFIVESRFKPEAAGAVAPSQLAGLAAQFGFNLAGGSTGESPEFYAGVLESRSLLREVVRTEFHIATDGDDGQPVTGTIAELYGIEGETPEDEMTIAVLLVDGLVSVTVDARQGVVILRTTAQWPELARQINRRMLQLVNEFNLGKRQSRAAAERHFVEQRVRRAHQELEAAEADLLEFYQRNRLYQDSPELSFERDRLERIVSLRQQVHNSLAQSYEQARIDEVRDTPVITIVDSADDALVMSGKNVKLSGVLGFIVGGMFALALAIALEYMSRERAMGSAEYSQFVELRRAIFSSLHIRRTGGSPNQKGSSGD